MKNKLIPPNIPIFKSGEKANIAVFWSTKKRSLHRTCVLEVYLLKGIEILSNTVK